MKKNIYILGGGTVQHVSPHLALCAPAYGRTAHDIHHILLQWSHGDNSGHNVELGLTKMAYSERGERYIGETNEDVEKWIKNYVSDDSIIFLNVAFCDFKPFLEDKSGNLVEGGKHLPRMKTKEGDQILRLKPAKKIVKSIRESNKSIFLVSWKTTKGATRKQMFEEGARLLKETSSNLVMVNDIHTRGKLYHCTRTGNLWRGS